MLDRVPIVGDLLDAGADDRVFDALLAAGPVVVAALALLGRGIVTTALAAGYVAVFALYAVAKGVGLVDYRRQ